MNCSEGISAEPSSLSQPNPPPCKMTSAWRQYAELQIWKTIRLDAHEGNGSEVHPTTLLTKAHCAHGVFSHVQMLSLWKQNKTKKIMMHFRNQERHLGSPKPQSWALRGAGGCRLSLSGFLPFSFPPAVPTCPPLSAVPASSAWTSPTLPASGKQTDRGSVRGLH